MSLGWEPKTYLNNILIFINKSDYYTFELTQLESNLGRVPIIPRLPSYQSWEQCTILSILTLKFWGEREREKKAQVKGAKKDIKWIRREKGKELKREREQRRTRAHVSGD